MSALDQWRLRFLPALCLLPLSLLFLRNELSHVSVSIKHHEKSSWIRQNNKNHSSFCSLLNNHHDDRDSSPTITPSRWWTSHFEDILMASTRHQREQRKWIRSLLATLSPELLQQGLQARPSFYSFQHIATRLNQRLQNPETHPPLQILVLGGSVTCGHGCNESPFPTNMRPRECAWPSRLESIVNALADMQLVKVYNVAVGATGIEFSIPLIRYQLYPDELKQNGGPDIIISSYATNEQASEITDTTKKSWRNKKLRIVQDFCKACSVNSCTQQPLVVLVDDYLGNRQDLIQREMSLHGVVSNVAQWYTNVMYVSYASVVRMLVRADTKETYFSSKWSSDNGEPRTNVHFGMGGHLTIAWSIVYAMMDVAIGYCDNEVFTKEMKRLGEEGVVSKDVQDLVNRVPPPELTPSLSLQHVSDEWRENAIKQRKKASKCAGSNSNDGNNSTSHCEFAFLAGPESTVRSTTEIADYLRPYQTRNTAWEPVGSIGEDGYIKKLGLAATHANASMTLFLPNIRRDVNTLNVQRIKSYGKRWAKSMAHFKLTVENPSGRVYTKQFDLDGYHDDLTSVSYPFEYNGIDAKRGSNITLDIDLVGGKNFKIIGLMLCE